MNNRGVQQYNNVSGLRMPSNKRRQSQQTPNTPSLVSHDSNNNISSSSSKRLRRRVNNNNDNSLKGAGTSLNTSTSHLDDNDGHLRMNADDEISTRYIVLKYLGKGTFGTVVECWDRTKGKRVAVKVIKAIQKYRDAALLELRVLEHLERFDKRCEKNILYLRDKFEHLNHVCMVFDLMSISLFDYMHQTGHRSIGNKHLQNISRQLFESVEFIHSLSIIHTDIKPENIMLVSDAQEPLPVSTHLKGLSSGLRRSARKNPAVPSVHRALVNTDIKLIDFGSAIFSSEYHSTIISTRHYRAPEVILCVGWSFPCDIWSIGCIMLELFTGETLFQTHDNLEHLVLMERILGHIPVNICNEAVSQSQGGQDFFRRATRGFELNYPDRLTTIESQKYVESVKRLESIVFESPRTIKHMTKVAGERSQLCEQEFLKAFLDLLSRCLEFDSRKRITARSALCHPFFSLAID